jgi:hypothetical protein
MPFPFLALRAILGRGAAPRHSTHHARDYGELIRLTAG